MMIAVPEKYALDVSSPTPITSERQHQEYLSVLDKLASKDNPTGEEEKYASSTASSSTPRFSSQGHVWSTAAYVTDYGEKVIPQPTRANVRIRMARELLRS